jgi:hypothetical protein
MIVLKSLKRIFDEVVFLTGELVEALKFKRVRELFKIYKMKTPPKNKKDYIAYLAMKRLKNGYMIPLSKADLDRINEWERDLYKDENLIPINIREEKSSFFNIHKHSHNYAHAH